MTDDFDPTDPPPAPPINPLVAYTQPPAGLAGIAVLQYIIAALMLLPAITSASSHDRPLIVWMSSVLPTSLLIISATGFLLRRGWGWWLTAAIFYAVFFSLPVNLVLWTIRDEPLSLPVQLIVFGVAVLVLAYIVRREFLRFFQFRTPDGTPTPTTLRSAAVVGLLWAVLGLIIALIR